MVFQVGDFDTHAFELLDLVDGAEFMVKVGNDELLVGQATLIVEGTRAHQIVLVAGVVVHTCAPLFANGKLFGLLGFESIFGQLILQNGHQGDAVVLRLVYVL